MDESIVQKVPEPEERSRIEERQTLVEYALLLALAVTVTILAVTLLGQPLSSFWRQIFAMLAR
jgi:Flp pilus assembly pilin Flp